MLARWPDEAGRAAYLAVLHAAQAFIVERTGTTVNSHRGVRHELGRLTKDEPRFDAELRSFLDRAYNLKVVADYDTGPGSEVSPERAAEAIEMSKRFVAHVILTTERI